MSNVKCPARLASESVAGRQMSNVSASGGKGFGIIEIIIVIAILAGAMFTFAQMATISLKALREEKKAVEASYLAQEAIEAVRAVRDSGWANISSLTAEADYYPQISGSAWVLAGGIETIGEYSRKIIVSDVSRDPATDDIEASYNPINDDPSTQKLTAEVSWGSKSFTLVTYITNF